jgi:hypothetical protein
MKRVFVWIIIVIIILSIFLPINTGKQTESIINNIINKDTIGENRYKTDNEEGPLGEWPDFTPIGFITAPHPDNSQIQTHLYGDWGGIVGEEFIFIQEDKIKLLYHSYHETYLTDHPHQDDVLKNWSLGYDPITKIKYTPLAKPGGPIPGPAWDHTDTPGYIKHPITNEHLIYNTVRPGTKYLHPEWDDLLGWEGAIQVAISNTSPSIGSSFEQSYDNILVAEYWWEKGWNQNGVIKGGLSEPTPVWVPHLGPEGMVRLFYRGLHGSPGSYWNWRISYADSEDGKTNWTKNPVPTFDPSDPNNPAYQWTLPWPQGFSFRGAWQAHCTGDVRADGVHMVLMVSNQNFAGSGHIAYYWSPDWGDTWIDHPDNPIIAPGQFPLGVPSEGFQRTPTLLFDEKYNRYILAYNAGHDVNEKWKRRTYISIAPRPENNPPETPEISGPKKGNPNEKYNFNFSNCIDLDGDDINYYVEWGDGDIDEGNIESGDNFSLSHTWSKKGDYIIKAQLIDVFGAEGDWTTFEVSIPKLKIFNMNSKLVNSFFHFLIKLSN